MVATVLQTQKHLNYTFLEKKSTTLYKLIMIGLQETQFTELAF